MGINASSIAQEIQQIANTGVKPVHFDWSAIVEANNQSIPILKVTSIDLDRNYIKRVSDYVVVRCVVSLGTYLTKIFPYKDNLIMTLQKKPKGEMGSASATASSGIENHRMRATILNAADHQLEGNTPFTADQVSADLTNLKAVDFQLVDLALEQTRMKTVGGIMRKTTPGDAVKFFMTALTKDLKVDANNQIKGVDMVDPDNKNVRDHIVIPQHMDFTEVPGWIHEHMGGIYNGGFGHYLQNGIWYVYPLYNTTRWQSTPKNLTLLNIPKNQMPGSDRTYRVTNNQVIILLTGENKHLDDSEGRQLNRGNGLRFAAASKIMEGFAKIANNKASVARVDNNTEFVANKRPTGLNNLPVSPQRITDNNFFQMSQMARSLGTFMMCSWENSDPGLLYPGMPVRYINVVNGGVDETFGCLVGAHHYTKMTTPGLTGGDYTNTSALTLFLDSNGVNKQPASASSGTLQGAI